jgi:hypothetical protein
VNISARKKMSKISRILATCLLAAGVSQVAPASAATLSVLATVDQTIQDTNDDGIPDALGPAGDAFLRVLGSGATWRAALEFNLGALPSTATLTGATLRLVDGGIQALELIEIHGYAGDGAIALADGTINNFLDSYLVLGNTGVANPHLIDVTAFVQSLLTGGANFAGFMLRAGTEAPGRIAGAEICSSESAGTSPCTSDFVPLLTLTYDDGNGNGGNGTVPEPGSLALFGAGALAYAAWRRGKARKAS